MDTERWLKRGNEALADKRWHDAEQAFVQALELEPTKMPAWHGLWKSVRLRVDVRTDEELASAIEAVEAEPASAAAWGQLGVALIGNQYGASAIAYRRWIDLGPDDASGWAVLAVRLAEKDPEAALRAVDRSIELGENSWTTRSEILSRLHRFEEAEAAARKALELQPSPYVSEWITLAVALWCLEKRDEAALAHLRATHIDTYDAYSFFRQAIESTGRSYEEAVEETVNSLTAVTTRYPGEASGWECLTEALADNTWAGDAIAAGRRATQVDPKSAGAWSALGKALYLEGDEAETVDAFTRAVELDPSDG